VAENKQRRDQPTAVIARSSRPWGIAKTGLSRYNNAYIFARTHSLAQFMHPPPSLNMD